jgi:hypothetical protein
MDASEYGLPERVVCPFCDRDESELHSPFGTALSVATYWCRRCRTAFEWVKWNDRESPGAPPDDSRSSRSA